MAYTCPSLQPNNSAVQPCFLYSLKSGTGLSAAIAFPLRCCVADGLGSDSAVINDIEGLTIILTGCPPAFQYTSRSVIHLHQWSVSETGKRKCTAFQPCACSGQMGIPLYDKTVFLFLFACCLYAKNSVSFACIGLKCCMLFSRPVWKVRGFRLFENSSGQVEKFGV